MKITHFSARFAMNGPVGLAETLAEAPVEWDVGVSSDGRGSLRIDAEKPMLIELAQVEGQGENLSFRQILYEADGSMCG